MILLGVSGRAGAGKNYFATWLQDQLPTTRVVERSFASALRREIELTLCPDSELGELVPLWAKPTSDEVRALLQWWGTDFRRAKNPDYWVNVVEQNLLEMIARNPQVIVVITDVRFLNEADMVRRLGGFMARIVASPDTRRRRLGGTLPPQHLSETAMDDYHFTFHIDGDVDGEMFVPPDLFSVLHLYERSR